MTYIAALSANGGDDCAAGWEPSACWWWHLLRSPFGPRSIAERQTCRGSTLNKHSLQRPKRPIASSSTSRDGSETWWAYRPISSRTSSTGRERSSKSLPSPDRQRRRSSAEAAALSEIATSLLAIGDTASARSAADQSRQILQGLVAADPGNAQWQRDLAASYDEIGHVQVAQGDLAGALTSIRDSVGIMERLTKSNPSKAGWQRQLAMLY